MKRGVAVGLLGLVALAGGCASPARFVEKKGDSGIIAIPSDTNSWPTYNRREALALIEKHVGPHYEIIEQGEVVTGQTVTNNSQVNTEPTPSRRNPALVGERLTGTSTTTQRNITEFRIHYQRVARPEPFISDINTSGAVLGGVTPAGGAMQPAQGPGSNIVPSVQPGGGAQRAGVPTSYFSPSKRVQPAGGIDCST